MKKRNSFLAFIVMLLIPIWSLGQWQAVMTNSIQGNVQKYVVHSDGNQYRYDYASDDINGVVIIKPEENITAIILIDEQKVHYTPTDGMMSQMNDPVQAYSSYLLYGVEKSEGNENVNGYDCIKTVVYLDEKALVTQWFSEELNFPVKMKNHNTENTFMHIENIKAWKPDPSIFIVPEEYVEVDENLNPVSPEQQNRIGEP